MQELHTQFIDEKIHQCPCTYISVLIVPMHPNRESWTPPNLWVNRGKKKKMLWVSTFNSPSSNNNGLIIHFCDTENNCLEKTHPSIK